MQPPTATLPSRLGQVKSMRRPILKTRASKRSRSTRLYELKRLPRQRSCRDLGKLMFSRNGYWEKKTLPQSHGASRDPKIIGKISTLRTRRRNLQPDDSRVNKKRLIRQGAITPDA